MASSGSRPRREHYIPDTTEPVRTHRRVSRCAFASGCSDFFVSFASHEEELHHEEEVVGEEEEPEIVYVIQDYKMKLLPAGFWQESVTSAGASVKELM